MKLLKLINILVLCLMPIITNAMCNVTSSTLNFGIYNPVSNQDTYVSGGIALNCDVTTSLSIKINTGNSGNFMSRHAINNSTNEFLMYNLYIDTGNTIVYGDGTNGTGFKNEVINSFGKVSTIYGFLPKLQTVSAGYYTDSLMIELSF